MWRKSAMCHKAAAACRAAACRADGHEAYGSAAHLGGGLAIRLQLLLSPLSW